MEELRRSQDSLEGQQGSFGRQRQMCTSDVSVADVPVSSTVNARAKTLYMPRRCIPYELESLDTSWAFPWRVCFYKWCDLHWQQALV